MHLHYLDNLGSKHLIVFGILLKYLPPYKSVTSVKKGPPLPIVVYMAMDLP
jgi:hypothetical protein